MDGKECEKQDKESRERFNKFMCKFQPSYDSAGFKIKTTYISKEEADKLQSKGYWYPLGGLKSNKGSDQRS